MIKVFKGDEFKSLDISSHGSEKCAEIANAKLNKNDALSVIKQSLEIIIEERPDEICTEAARVALQYLNSIIA